jgi:hypothetical protein
MELLGVVIEFALLVHPKRDGQRTTTVISAGVVITGRHAPSIVRKPKAPQWSRSYQADCPSAFPWKTRIA